jgi:long-chain acyl-CoA synthetase
MVTATCGKARRTAATFESSVPQWVVVEFPASAADVLIEHATAESKSLDQDHLGRAFEEVALKLPGRPAVVSDGGVVSYGDLLAAAHAVRHVLQTELHISQGDRVVILLPNSPEYVAAFYGALLAGAIVVPLPPDAESSRLSHAISATEASVVLSSKKVLRRRKPELAAEPVELSLREFSASEVGHSDALEDADAPAAVFFTSGSSGEPKGVTLSHRNLLANAASIIEYLGITSDERALGLLPFYHAFGNSVLQTHMLSGAALVLAGSSMFPETILDAVETHSVTSLSGVPDLFQTLLSRTSLAQRELPSLRYLAVAGGRLDPDQAQTLAFRVAPAKLIIMYGQTEATARLSYLPAEEFESRYGSIGRGISGVELQVVNEHGEPVAPGVTGEIRARGPNVMLGYWEDPVATSRTIRNGWLYTGDLAIVDDDGFIYPQGRKSGLVKVAGFRVHPAEIEDFIRREADVLEAVAVPFEAASLGTRFALFARPWEGDRIVTAESLRSLCANHLPRHKVPEYVEVLHTLPLNDGHKVDRRALRRRAESIAHVR